jgi:hypothetical protein
MTSLNIPDVNVWLALLMADHVHRHPAIAWWETTRSATHGFCRITQISVLRVLTTAAAMNGKPLTMLEAWAVHDRLFEDERVVFLPEPAGLQEEFRARTILKSASPKVWADAYLGAFAAAAGATLVTFDRALKDRSGKCLVLTD